MNAKRTRSVLHQPQKAGTARRIKRVLAVMTGSRRIEELESEARYRNSHDLYRTRTHRSSPRLHDEKPRLSLDAHNMHDSQVNADGRIGP